MELNKRWYDENPKVSLAVGCLESADKALRNKLARIIIKNAMELGVSAKRPAPALFRRWYDKDPDLCLAMEYFKNCDDVQRQVVAENIIYFIKSGMSTHK